MEKGHEIIRNENSIIKFAEFAKFFGIKESQRKKNCNTFKNLKVYIPWKVYHHLLIKVNQVTLIVIE
jgi:hypothetical protein